MSQKTKKILFTISGFFLMAFGIYGMFVWWGPLFAQILFGLLSLSVFGGGLALFFRGRNLK